MRIVRSWWLVVLVALAVLSSSSGLGARSRSVAACAAQLAAVAEAAAHAEALATKTSATKTLALPTEPTRLVLPEEAGIAIAYPPLAAAAGAAAGAAAPVAFGVVTMLHGMCGQPENACGFWQEAATERGWLFCPGGNVRCGGNHDWRGSGEEKAQHLDLAEQELRQRFGAAVAEEPGLLVGFSRGAFVARDVVYARPGRYRGVVFIGAAMVPDPEQLKRSGIERVIFASGDYDGARPTMIKATAVAIRAGLEARFVSLGPIWHQLPRDMDRVMRDALAWVSAAPHRAAG